jgi:hypothetical protein
LPLRPVCEYAQDFEQLWQPLDLVQDHESFESSEGELRRLEFRSINGALEIEELRRGSRWVHAGQGALAALPGPEKGGYRAGLEGCFEAVEGFGAGDHARMLTLKIRHSVVEFHVWMRAARREALVQAVRSSARKWGSVRGALCPLLTVTWGRAAYSVDVMGFVRSSELALTALTQCAATRRKRCQGPEESQLPSILLLHWSPMRSPTPRRIAWVLAMLLVLAVSSGIYRSGPTAPLAALPVASAALAESDSSPLFVYVDPIYGDDAQAGVLNPTTAARILGHPRERCSTRTLTRPKSLATCSMPRTRSRRSRRRSRTSSSSTPT